MNEVIELLRGVTPPLDGDVYERFVEHDVRLEDLRDPGFDKEALRLMGIVRVGVQLRILREVDRAFPSRQQGRGSGHGATADSYRMAAPASKSGAAAQRRDGRERRAGCHQGRHQWRHDIPN